MYELCSLIILVGQHALQDKASLFDEQWDGSDEEELSCIVSEVYLLSHLLE